MALRVAAPKAPKVKPKPPPVKGPAVPLPGWPTREGLDTPTIWKGKPAHPLTVAMRQMGML